MQVTEMFTGASGLLMIMGGNQRSMRSLLVRLANVLVRVFVNGRESMFRIRLLDTVLEIVLAGIL
uniref:Uncharacterized protein n=1 Tax=Corynebacterium silvaticum TaxID=2320431 RepID=A0A7U5HKE7_9CORY